MGFLRVGIDGSCWANQRGYGRFTREICSALVAEGSDCRFIFFLDERSAEIFELEGENVERVLVPQGAAPTEAASAEGHRAPLDMLRFSRAAWRARLAVFFSPSVYTYFPLPPGLPAVVTIHDTIPERYPELTLTTRKARLFWRAKVRLAIAQARRVLTVSPFSARDIQNVLGVPPERIRVALEAPSSTYAPSSAEDCARSAQRLGLPAGARWFTYVGGFNPHKHVDLLVEAHAALGAPSVHLLLVGPSEADSFHKDLDGIRAAIVRAGTNERVHFTGFLSDEELRNVHTGSIALVLPSECEGFGLPAVEAAACGAPVIATDQSPLPELLRGGGIFVPPGRVADLVEAMQRMLQDEGARVRMGESAIASARALSWSRSARSVLDVLREVAR
jgi:glycosyltransferase involved in cell wall biosynthesis